MAAQIERTRTIGGDVRLSLGGAFGPTKILGTTIARRPVMLHQETGIAKVSIAPDRTGILARIQIMNGDLPYGRRFRRPILVTIEQDEEDILISEPMFHMHAAGATEFEAAAAFRRIVSGYVDVLQDREATLGHALKAQLAYLREIVESR